MTEELCPGCGCPVGMGTLLDQFPTPPVPRTTIHRLYLLVESNFEGFPTPEAQERLISQEDWTTFAVTRRCITCVQNTLGDETEEEIE